MRNEIWLYKWAVIAISFNQTDQATIYFWILEPVYYVVLLFPKLLPNYGEVTYTILTGEILATKQTPYWGKMRHK